MFLGSLFKCHFPTLSAFLDEIEVYRQFLNTFDRNSSDIPIIVTTTSATRLLTTCACYPFILSFDLIISIPVFLIFGILLHLFKIEIYIFF